MQQHDELKEKLKEVEEKIQELQANPPRLVLTKI